MTEEQLLDLTTDELSVVAGEVLHHNDKGMYVFKKTDGLYYCCNCGMEQIGIGCGKQCWQSRLPMTWPEAMKWRDWAVKKYGVVRLRGAMDTIYYDMLDKRGDEGWRRHDSRIDFLLSDVQPVDYILAAVICEIRGK